MIFIEKRAHALDFSNSAFETNLFISPINIFSDFYLGLAEPVTNI